MHKRFKRPTVVPLFFALMMASILWSPSNVCFAQQLGAPAKVNLNAEDLTTEKVGSSISPELIGEPVSAVNLKRPHWKDGPNGEYGLVEGEIMPVDPKGKAINFRVVLPSVWSCRSAQLGFSWAKNVYPEHVRPPYAMHNAEWTTVAALEFIEENKDGPFYLHLCSALLHGPDRSWRKSMDHPLVTGVGEVESRPEVMTPREELLKTITEKGFNPDSEVAGEAWIDDSLRAILRKLKELGIDDNTLVIFTPDHGRDGKASVFSHGGCQVPMIMRWPKGIAAGQVCEELVQNIDLVPTFFELGKAEKPESYRIDGQSLTPLFENGKAKDWRSHLYLEMGAARAMVTKDWSYIAVRHTKEQIAAIKKTSPHNLPKAISYIGCLGIGVRGADRPGFFDEDQLCNLRRDAREMKNLAYNEDQATRIEEMRYLMQ